MAQLGSAPVREKPLGLRQERAHGDREARERREEKAEHRAICQKSVHATTLSCRRTAGKHPEVSARTKFGSERSPSAVQAAAGISSKALSTGSGRDPGM
jgi:hypothetical protein